jgi:beta-lactamase class A
MHGAVPERAPRLLSDRFPRFLKLAATLLFAAVIVNACAEKPSERPEGSANIAPATSLQVAIEAVASREQATLGIVIKNLETGEYARLNADERMRSASLYKLFVLYVAYADLEAGDLTLDEVLTFSEQAFAVEPFAEWPAGTRTTAGCALDAMTTRSSNAAAAMLVERLGGEDRITLEMRALGMKQSELTVDRAWSSPADIALLLELIATGKAVSPRASEEMLSLLLRQERAELMPAALPLGLDVAHKTGELRNIRNDAGVVFAPDGPYVFVAFTADARNDAAARAALVAISAAAYAYFEQEESTLYYGLPQPLAEAVFAVPDASGRLAVPAAAWAVTTPAGQEGVRLAQGAESVWVRDEIAPDLVALQDAAAASDVPIWVTAGYRAPTDAEAPLAKSGQAPLSCALELPSGPAGQARPRPVDGAEESVPPVASQHWLGTTVAVTTVEDGEAEADKATSMAWSWLLENAWQYGFIPALPESSDDGLPWEPWNLRWVGKEMAAHLRAMTPEHDPSIVAAELQRAGRELALAAIQ